MANIQIEQNVSLFKFLVKKVILFNLSVGLVLVVAFSCKRLANDKTINEGMIEYNIFYLDDEPPQFDTNIRPDRMIVRFKDNYTINRIEALSGAFSLAFIQDLDTKTATTLVKIFNKKLYYQEAIIENGLHFAYEAMPKLTIQKVSGTEKFLGFTCKKAIASFNDSTFRSFEIWYTDDIKVTMPNHNTPFEEIDGIMLKFSVILFSQKMDITAISVKPIKLAKDEFNVSLEYEEVNHETMMELIYLFQ